MPIQEETTSMVDLYCGMHKVWKLAEYAQNTIAQISIDNEDLAPFNSIRKKGLYSMLMVVTNT